MPLELIRVTTNDELYLDGALLLPESEVSSSLPVDAFLLIHGTGAISMRRAYWRRLHGRRPRRGCRRCG